MANMQELKRLFEKHKTEYLKRTKKFPPLYKDWSCFKKLTSDFNLHSTRLEILSNLVIDSVGEQKNILDIGCNTGLLATRLAMQLTGVRIVAEDLSELQIEVNNVLKEIFSLNNVTFRQKDASGESTEKYNVVIMSELLEHFEFESDCQKKVVKYAKDSLDEDGVLYITVPYEDAIPFSTHFTFFTREMLSKLLEDQGLKVEYLEYLRSNEMKKHFFIKCT